MSILLNFRHLGLICLCSLSFSLGLGGISPVLAQDPLTSPGEDLSDPSNVRPLTESDSLLSLQGGERLMAESIAAIDNQDYPLAAKKLQEARQIFNQLTNFYQQLSNSFSGIYQPVSESQKGSALAAAQKRDEATYQLALVHRASDQPELAVPLLAQIIRSQNPTTELGAKAYKQLYELGFVDVPFPSDTPSFGNELRPLKQPDSFLSILGGDRLMAEGLNALESQDYNLATRKFQEARQVFNQLTNFYQQLSSGFTGIDTEVSDNLRRQALRAGQKRDLATYRLALAHKSSQQPELAVPLFIQIVRSQNPTSELGQEAYQQLFDLGFVDSPYPPVEE